MEEEIKPALSNVHQALQSAVYESQQPRKPEMIAAHFKIDADMKTLTEQICERHGVTLSAFVRKCCEHLVTDYQGLMF